MTHIHWLGAGLSSVPGIRRLARLDYSITVWNRTLVKAQKAVAGLGSANVQTHAFDCNQLATIIKPGDVVVSMLPAAIHLELALLCLEKKTHFVCSSYISESLMAIDQQVREQQLCFNNECGLDPGLDHLFAHALVNEYRNSDVYNPLNTLAFRSYCGGFPAVANDFTYKFSWSPHGVLKALKSPARWIAFSQEHTTKAPYKEVKPYVIEGEIFEAYPNRDSIPFIEQYNFESNWNIEQFVRGTLRLNGWSEAWQDIFAIVDKANGAAGEQELADLSESLWQQYQYDESEADRVVLSVELEAKNDRQQAIWHQQYLVDTIGNDRGSAMARLVSIPVSLTVESIINGELETGVTSIPSDPQHISNWIASLRDSGERIELKNLVIN